MTDNFAIIKDFLQSQWGGDFDSFKDAFYMIDIIGRRKDGANIEAHKFKTYFIKEIGDLDKYENEIKTLCDALQMRAYISVNSKSWRKVTLNTMACYAERISHDLFDKPQSVFDSCAAKFVDKSSQLWIIDVDKEDAELFGLTLDEVVALFAETIETKVKPNKKIVTVIPTKSGKHIICHPFDCYDFIEIIDDKMTKSAAKFEFTSEDLIKKNNPTLLYENVK